LVGSQLVEGVAGELVQLARQFWVGGPGVQLLSQTCARKASCAAAVRDDVSNRLAVNCQGDALACLHGIDDGARSAA
jgi:hypothetical protein